MSSHPGELSLEKGDKLTTDSSEIARIWITNNAGSSVWIDATILEAPIVFGYLMADTIRHAARAYATTWNIDEGEALQAIVQGTTDELREQFGDIETIQPGGLH
jgi:hypothetical protein